MNKNVRTVALFLLSGAVWCFMMRLCFVWSGAQQILSNPSFQSSKFLKVFMEVEPLPRMFSDKFFVLEGFAVCGLFLATAFTIINPKLSGSWLKRGAIFGLLHWMLMVPWFEFYLPYNVMHEPFSLVAFEGLLWMITNLATGILLSFVINFKRAK